MKTDSQIKEYSFSFSELDINPADVAELLGFSDGIVPEPFSEYISDAMKNSENLPHIKGAVFYENNIHFPEGKSHISIDQVDFLLGKTIAHELEHSESVALFICTAGKEISELAQNLLLGENPVRGYVYDVLGSVTVEAVSVRLHQEIKELAVSSGESVTNRYSPGYCHWNVADQHKLFSFFPENCCGIRLTDSALMYPIKSVSGIIGCGKKVKYRQYTCDLCSLTDCFYRNRHKEK